MQEIGSAYEPYEWRNKGLGIVEITSEIKGSDLMRALMGELMDRDTAQEAEGDVFASLLQKPELAAWKTYVEAVRKHVHILRRHKDLSEEKSGFSLDVLQQSFADPKKAISSRGELLSLLETALESLQQDITGSDVYPSQMFWNTDSNTPKPKKENECRNVLVHELRSKLTSYGLSFAPGAQSVRDSKVDIRVCAHDSNISIPIEIKCSTSLRLMRGLREQLMGKYARQKEHQGYGLFLVLWFGKAYLKGDDFAKPKDLQRALEKEIPKPMKGKVRVRVFSVAL